MRTDLDTDPSKTPGKRADTQVEEEDGASKRRRTALVRRISRGELADLPISRSRLMEVQTPQEQLYILLKRHANVPANLAREDLLRIGMYLFDEALSHAWAVHFVNPVPASADIYHSEIHIPMDLSTAERKLWAGQDATLHGLYADIAQIMMNAWTFHPETSVIHVDACKMFWWFRQSIVDNVDAYLRTIETRRHGLSSITNSEVPFSLSSTIDSPLLAKAGWTRACEPQDVIGPKKLPHEELDLTKLQLGLDSPLYILVVSASASSRRLSPRVMERLEQLLEHVKQINADSHVLPMARQKTRNFIRAYVTNGRKRLVQCREDPRSLLIVLSDVALTDGHTRMQCSALITKPISEPRDLDTLEFQDLTDARYWVRCVVLDRVKLDIRITDKFRMQYLRIAFAVFRYTDDRLPSELHDAFVTSLGLADIAGRVRDIENLVPYNATTNLESKSPVRDRAVFCATPASAMPTSMASVSRASASRASVSPSPARLLSSTLATTSPAPMTPVPAIPTPAIPAPAIPAPAIPAPAKQAPTKQAPTSPVPVCQMSIHPVPNNVAQPVADKNSSNNSISSSSSNTNSRTSKMMALIREKARIHGVSLQTLSQFDRSIEIQNEGCFKRVFNLKNNGHIVVQVFKEINESTIRARVAEIVCCLKTRGENNNTGQIQSIYVDEQDELVGLSMTRYERTLKDYACNIRRPPTPHQKYELVLGMVNGVRVMHATGFAHRDLSDVNMMVSEKDEWLEDNSRKPELVVIDFGKAEFVEKDDVCKWSSGKVPQEQLDTLPKIRTTPDHGYVLYRSPVTLPNTKFDYELLPAYDPLAEDVYSLGVLILRTITGHAPWNGVLDTDLRALRDLVSSTRYLRDSIERSVSGKCTQELLLRCIAVKPELRSTAKQLWLWLQLKDVREDLLREWSAMPNGRARQERRRSE